MAVIGLDDDRSLDLRNTKAFEAMVGAIKNINNPLPVTPNSNFRVKDDGTLQIWNADQLRFHSINIAGNAGEERILIGPGEP